MSPRTQVIWRTKVQDPVNTPGGWREADTMAGFLCLVMGAPKNVVCNITVGAPIRTGRGPISEAVASQAVIEAVQGGARLTNEWLRRTDPKGSFTLSDNVCRHFIDEVSGLLNGTPTQPGLMPGSRVNRR